MALSRTVGGGWSVAVTLVVTAVMATIAVVTVRQAGCDDPGRYVATAGGYELVGGCLVPGDLPVTPGAGSEPADPTEPGRRPVRP